MPIQVLFDGFDTWEPTESSYEIINYEVAGDVAMVAIDSQFGEARFAELWIAQIFPFVYSAKNKRNMDVLQQIFFGRVFVDSML